jgi:hypothetical protein
MISKIKDLRLKIKDQRGVTLLLSVFVLSGITLISITVGFFTIQEIRSSRAIILSEPAIAAAESAGERGLWAIKRSGAITECSNGVTTQNIGGAIVDYCRSYGAAVINLEAGQSRTLFLYNPNDINGDIDLSEFPYTFFQTNHITGNFSVSVVIDRLDGNSVGNANVSPGGVESINVPSVPQDIEARMRVTLSSASDATVRVNTNQGLPNVPTIDAAGCSSESPINNCSQVDESFKRRINIIVPE